MSHPLAYLAQTQGRLAGAENVWGKDPCAASPVVTPRGTVTTTFGVNFDKGHPLDRAKRGEKDVFECIPNPGKWTCEPDEVRVTFRGQYGCMKMADIEAGKWPCDLWGPMAICLPPFEAWWARNQKKVAVGAAVVVGLGVAGKALEVW